jgi:hypothetical protein
MRVASAERQLLGRRMRLKTIAEREAELATSADDAFASIRVRRAESAHAARGVDRFRIAGGFSRTRSSNAGDPEQASAWTNRSDAAASGACRR